MKLYICDLFVCFTPSVGTNWLSATDRGGKSDSIERWTNTFGDSLTKYRKTPTLTVFCDAFTDK